MSKTLVDALIALILAVLLATGTITETEYDALEEKMIESFMGIGDETSDQTFEDDSQNVDEEDSWEGEDYDFVDVDYEHEVRPITGVTGYMADDMKEQMVRVANNEANVGMNIPTPTYFDNTVYFSDLTRQATSWRSFSTKTWDWGDGRVLNVDNLGNPISLESDQGAMMIVSLEQQGVNYIEGGYKLTWEGEGNISVQMNNEIYEFGPESKKQQILDFQPIEGENMIVLYITKTNSADPIRNVHLWLPGYDENSSIFTDHALTMMAPFNPIRFKDWSVVDISSPTTWEERAHKNQASWGEVFEGTFVTGVPYEIQIELANTLKKDMWIAIPHAVDDQYIESLAKLINEQLDPELKVWVEYSNEIWNWIFPVNSWLYDQSQLVTRPDPDEDYSHYHLYGEKASTCIEIFEREFTNPDRVIGVLAVQAGYSYPAEAAFSEINKLDTLALFDVLAIAPYFGNESEEIDKLMLESLPDMTAEQRSALKEGYSQIIDNLFDPSNELGQEIARHKELAEQYDLTLVSYEGGQHITDYMNPAVGNTPQLLNEDEMMYDLYTYYLEQWESFSDDGLMCLYTLSGGYRHSEAFGHMSSYVDSLEEAPKMHAVLDYIESKE